MTTTVKIPEDVMSVFLNAMEQGDQYDHEDSPSEQYYGFLVEIENAVNKEDQETLWSVQFELVPKEWMDVSVLGYKEELKDLEKFQPPISPASFFVLDEATPETIAREFEIELDELHEGEWYIITLGKHGAGGTKAAAKSKPSGGIKKTSGKGKHVSKKTSRILRKSFTPKSGFLMSAIKRLLGMLQCDEVGVMDVGQASCNLIYSNTGVAQFYVDVGLPLGAGPGGALWGNGLSLPPVNAAGNRAVINPGPCLQNNPFVLITHWHWDHYTMAVTSANNAALTNRHWITPTAPLGGAGNNVWMAIPAANRHAVPQGAPAFAGGTVTVIPCVPGPGIPIAAMNDTGLAVVVHVDAVNNQSVLLPGDAAYQSIPGLGAYNNLRWMVASHHGSNTNLVPASVPAPNVANQGRISYSYGITAPVPVAAGPPANHCYGHPDPPAVATFVAAGWGANILTNDCTAETHPNSNVAGRGNIMMCNHVIPPVNPANPDCPFHAFPKILI